MISQTLMLLNVMMLCALCVYVCCVYTNPNHTLKPDCTLNRSHKPFGPHFENRTPLDNRMGSAQSPTRNTQNRN
ncbi:hypothetical protein HanXRQr2_Chr03g0099331 [Helianthus annuus]|uniref:Uncharacterized protein n=1 Tax=Helianthus annuus TaxID=4232 RepID=A0A9K3JEJ6_HELAN|nr:hypothetical protein HanXRQr2_Chr03g0099331 [Helianthus annuus]KAJ0942736.1 hypothetical protein HanPSC8_Chr03g0095621 [Helianthus annuus]